MTVSAFVATAIDGAVAAVSLSRPERRNAFNDKMAEQFAAALAGLHGDPAVHVHRTTSS